MISMMGAGRSSEGQVAHCWRLAPTVALFRFSEAHIRIHMAQKLWKLNHPRLGRSQNSSRDQGTLLQIIADHSARDDRTGRKESLDSLTEGLCESIVGAVTNPNLKRSNHLVHFLCSQFRDQLPLATSGCFAFQTDDLLTSFLPFS